MRLLTFMLMALAVCFLTVSSMAALEDDLISAWTFDDGSARDHAGSNDGTFKNGAKAGAGKKGQGLVLNNPKNPAAGKNTGQYVEIPNSKSLEQADGVFSVSLWFNAKKGGGRDHAGLFFIRRENWLGSALYGSNSHHHCNQSDLRKLLERYRRLVCV